jgi:hypothetical protein
MRQSSSGQPGLACRCRSPLLSSGFSATWILAPALRLRPGLGKAGIVPGYSRQLAIS